MPASYGIGEILGVLVLTKGNLRFDAKDRAAGRFEKWANVAAVFIVVDLDELLPDGTIFDFFGDAFEDDGLIGFFSADHNMRVRSHILCFAGARTGAEPEGVLPPNSPDKHEMRMAIWTRGGNPVIV